MRSRQAPKTPASNRRRSQFAAMLRAFPPACLAWLPNRKSGSFESSCSRLGANRDNRQEMSIGLRYVGIRVRRYRFRYGVVMNRNLTAIVVGAVAHERRVHFVRLARSATRLYDANARRAHSESLLDMALTGRQVARSACLYVFYRKTPACSH